MKRFNSNLLVIIVLFCVLRASGEAFDELTDADYAYDEDYESSESSATDALNITSTTNKVPSELTAVTKTIHIENLPAKEMKCPKNCKCSDGFYLVDCSHRHLKQIPKDLPYSTVQLNLSHNLLTKLDVNDLIKCTELRQIFLQNNRIETIFHPEIFSKLPYLHHIDLSTNALKPLHGNEFSNAKSLAALLLTNNKNVIAKNVAIVQAPRLKTLNLANCSITQLSNNTFQNLTSLVALYLDNNPLNLRKSIDAFKYLINLRTLSIPTVSPDKALDLCRNLDAIDIIHLSSETHEISCFLLISGSTYEESMIRLNLYKVPTDVPITTTSTEKSLNNIISGVKDVLHSQETKNGNTYDQMCMVYMIISGLAVVLLAAILVAFCVIGSSRFGREIFYRKQSYHKYYPQNLTVENQNYEAYLMESERKI